MIRQFDGLGGDFLYNGQRFPLASITAARVRPVDTESSGNHGLDRRRLDRSSARSAAGHHTLIRAGPAMAAAGARGSRTWPAGPARRYGRNMNTRSSQPAIKPVVLSDRFEQALQFAATTHRSQVRKGSGIPYIGHLLGVCSLVIEDGGDEDEAIAALLHDAAEDQGGEEMLDEIRRRFGDRVATIVAACSDTFESPKPPWRARKGSYLEHLEQQPKSVLRVSLADKLFNARAILRDYLVVGDELWARFQSGRDGQLWYYRELADRFMTLLPGRMAGELATVVDDLEQAVGVR